MIVGERVPQTAKQIEAIAEVVKAAALFDRACRQKGSTDYVAYQRLADAVTEWEDACPRSAINLYAEEGG